MSRSHNRTFKSKVGVHRRDYPRPWAKGSEEASPAPTNGEARRAQRTKKELRSHSSRMALGRAQRGAYAQAQRFRPDEPAEPSFWNPSTISSQEPKRVLNSAEYRAGLVDFEPVRALAAPAEVHFGTTRHETLRSGSPPPNSSCSSTSTFCRLLACTLPSRGARPSCAAGAWRSDGCWSCQPLRAAQTPVRPRHSQPGASRRWRRRCRCHPRRR